MSMAAWELKEQMRRAPSRFRANMEPLSTARVFLRMKRLCEV